MAGCTGKGPEVIELRERLLASTERQLFLETVPEPYQLESNLALAWTILSAAYSAKISKAKFNADSMKALVRAISGPR